MSGKSILFIPSNGTHVRLFYPIYKILKEKYQVVFLTQGSFKNEGTEDALFELGIDFKKIDDFKTIDPEFIMSEEKIGVVVVGNDTDVIPQWFINTATILGISSVYIQDGLLFDYETPSIGIFDAIFKKRGTNSKLKSLSSKLLLSKKIRRLTTHGIVDSTVIHAWGKATENYLIEKGVNKKRILITGAIQANKIKKIENQNMEKTILYAPSDLAFSGIVNSKELREQVHQVCSTLSSLDCKIVVKPHPSEDAKIFKEIDNYQNVAISNQNIYELLPKSSLVITDLSSFAMEALAACKPLVIYFPNIGKIVKSGSFPLDLVSKNAVFLAKSTSELLNTTKGILEGNLVSKKELVEGVVVEYLGPMDGMEAARSANSIMSMLEKN